MKYRPFGRLQWQSSVLGFGCMRLPRKPDDPTSFDVDEAIRMVRYAVDHGVNYLDTAYLYRGNEVVVGQALRDGYRERVKLATKLPVGDLTSVGDADRILSEQLERLDVGHIDFYLLHDINLERWNKARTLGLLPWLESLVNRGIVNYLGFSCHSRTEEFKQIVDGYDNWTMTLVQHNYLDADSQVASDGVAYAHANGLAVTIMEPLRGGLLADLPSPPARAVLEALPTRRSPAEWGLNWLWNKPEISLCLSGMSTMAQVEENVAAAGRARAGMLSEGEMAALDRVAQELRGSMPIPCTGCGYCVPCPHGVDIPHMFLMYNQATMYGEARLDRLAAVYPRIPAPTRCDYCQDCGECTARCPQAIAVPESLSRIHEEITARGQGQKGNA